MKKLSLAVAHQYDIDGQGAWQSEYVPWHLRGSQNKPIWIHKSISPGNGYVKSARKLQQKILETIYNARITQIPLPEEGEKIYVMDKFTNEYYPLNQFKVCLQNSKCPSKGYRHNGIDNNEVANVYNIKHKEKWFKINIKYARYILNGDENMPVKNFNTGKWPEAQIDELTGAPFERSTLQYHHMDHTSKGSTFKNKHEPSVLLSKEVWTQNNFLEWCRIIPLTNGYHKDHHNNHVSSNLHDWPKKYWPWAIRTKKNFEEFCKKYNINDVTYEEITA